MKLRGRISQPLRYEDEDIHARKPYERRKNTKPAFPELLEEQTKPFNPNHPPAAFPSLPLGSPQPPKPVPAQNRPEDCARGPEPRIYSPRDVSRLTERRALEEEPDSAMGNDLTADNGQGDKSLHPTIDGPVTWGSLELAYQYRIFCALCKITKEDNVVSWLRLAEPQHAGMREAVEWRQGFPITLTQFRDGQNTLANCMDPKLLMQYADLMVKVGHYELGSPLQLLRAGIFLQQVDLPTKLLGTWVSDPLGSGQLVDATPLAECFPAMTMSAQQLQDLCLQAARGLEPSLETNKDHASNDANVPRPKARRSVTRPRKRKPTLLEDISRASSTSPPPRQTVEVIITAPSTQQLQGVETSETTSESSEDYITVLNRWTKPLPRSIPDPSASFSEQLSQRPEEETPPSAGSQKTVTPNVPVSSSSSNEARSSGSMSLRGRSNLKETEAMSALRKDQDFWSDSRLSTSPSRSVTEPARTQSPERDPLALNVEVKTPKLTLRISDAGVVSVSTSASPSPSIPRGGKSLSNFATPEMFPQPDSSAAKATDLSSAPAPVSAPFAAPDTSMQPISSPNIVTDLSPAPAPVATPRAPSMVFTEPTRAEEAFKQSMRSIDVPTSSPTRFGDASNFETKLIMSPAAQPRTPDSQELGVFDNDAERSVYQTARSGRDEAEKELFVQESASPSPSPMNNTTMRPSPLLGKAIPTIDNIVPSIEHDIEMLDDPMPPEENAVHDLASAAAQLLEDMLRGRRPEIDDRKSPLRPRSISPISDNEDFEEYHQWLKGERDHGPMPRNQKPDTSQEPPEVLPTNPRANEHPADQPMALAAEQHDASPESHNTTTPEPKSHIVTLQVQVTPKELENNSLPRASGAGIYLQDPGEEGDSEYEDQAPLKKQTPKTTPAKPATPTKAFSARLNSAKVTKKNDSTEKGSVKKAPALLIAKPTTRAQSLAAEEINKTSTAGASAAVPKALVTPPSIEVVIPQVSPAAAAHMKMKEAAPRRSARLSSVESTDASDSSQTQPRKRRKIDAPLHAKPTPTSRLRQSLTPSASSRRSGTKQRTTVESLRDEDGFAVQDSASEADSEDTDGPAKPKKKWAHKVYEKTRESPRLADQGVPNMKV